MTLRTCAIGMIVALTLPPPASGAGGAGGPAPDAYHDHTELSARLRALAAAHSSIATVTSIGRSFEGRELLVLTLGSSSPGKPAVFVDACHDGRELTASEVALGLAEHLLESLPPDSLIDVLSETTVHILARANPDGAERGFTGAQPAKAIPRPYDEDRDERIDEDGPEDINGDGIVGWMRVEDPAGEWTGDPADARLLVKREADDKGPFYRRYREGLDNDDDGLLGEDPEGGVALLHNFPQGWEMETFQPGAGPHAASEEETRAILEFFIAHPEIALVISLSQADRPERPGVGAKSYVPDDDANAYEAIAAWVEAARGRKLDAEHESEGQTRIGGAGQLIPEPQANAPGPSAPRAIVPGHLAEWSYFQAGAFTIMPKVWVSPPEPPQEAAPEEPAEADSADAPRGDETADPGEQDEDAEKPEPRDPDGAGWLRFIEETGSAGFVDWTPFDHPTLGLIEVGGFAPEPRYYATPEAIDSLSTETASLLIELGKRLGRVRARAFESTALTPELHRVTLTVENVGDLPTLSARGADARLFHQALCEISLSSGTELVDTPERVRLGRLAPGERRTVEWLVKGAAGEPVGARVWTVRAGQDEASLTLSR